MAAKDFAGSVIAHRNDRMGARLISLLNAIRVSREYNVPWYCGWTTGGRTHEECRDPTMIFADDFVDEKFFDNDELSPIIDDLIDLSTVSPGSSATQFLGEVNQGKMYLAGNMMGAIALPWEDEKDIAKRLPEGMSELRFSEPVANMIKEIDAMFAGKRVTALHIRRGDIIYDRVTSNKLWPNKYIPREYYEILLKYLLKDPKVQVLVFSDTPQEVTRLKQMGDRVLGVEELFGNREFTSGARDFLELFAMSRCKMIFGPPSSAFSQTATTIGGGRIQDVQASLSPGLQDEAMELMTKRLEAKSDLFINDGDIGQCLHFLIEHLMKKNQPGRAKKIIKSYLDDGLDKSFTYPLLCELAVSSNDLPLVEDIRKIAYQRPVYVDESLAVVNSYSALHFLKEGKKGKAQERLMSAIWYRPLDPFAQGAANLALTCEAITPENFYPFDPALTRQKGAVFPAGKKSLNDLNEIRPKGMGKNKRFDFHPWDIVVRDWRLLMGKRLNRAFSNKPKIEKYLQAIERQYHKIDAPLSLMSAKAVLQSAIGDVDAAFQAQSFCVLSEPNNPLFHKRLADIQLLRENNKQALEELSRANNLAKGHPCYAAAFAHRLWFAKRRNKCFEVFSEIAKTDHNFVEIHLLTADFLRRDKDRLEEALAELEKGIALAHGAQRLMTAKANLLMQMDRVDEAYAIFEEIAEWGLGSEHVFANIYRQFDKLEKPDLAKGLIDRSAFDFETVQELLAADA